MHPSTICKLREIEHMQFCSHYILLTCDFVCATMSHTKLSLHLSVIHYQVLLSDILGVVSKHLLQRKIS